MEGERMPEKKRNGSLGDVHVTIEGDRDAAEYVMELLTGLPRFETSYIDFLKFDGEREEASVSVDLLNDVPRACEECDFYDHRAFDPAARCALGASCTAAVDGCRYRRTKITDINYGALAEDDIVEANAGDTLIEALEDLRVSRFRAQMCLDAPNDYSRDDKRGIALDLCTAEEDAFRAAALCLSGLAPEERRQAIASLAEPGPDPGEMMRMFVEEEGEGDDV